MGVAQENEMSAVWALVWRLNGKTERYLFSIRLRQTKPNILMDLSNQSK